MDIKEIKQVIALMNEHDLALFHLERDGVKIKLKKGADLDSILKALGRSPSEAAEGSSASEEPRSLPAPAEPVDEVPRSVISAPTVGTFYRQPDPDSEPFIKIGDRVEEDTVVCIIEAMKVMNEIKAETKGTIQKVLAEDGKPVQYKDPLFEVLPG